MKELQDYKALIRKGSDHYLSILKKNDLYDEVLQRINRKNKSEPISLIHRIFKDQSNFSEYLFSDLTYSLDYFYEGFELNLKQIIDLSFQDLEYDYQIITQFHDRQTKEIKSSTTLYSNGKQGEIDAELFASLVNSSDMQWKVVFNQESEKLEFNWFNYDEENLINFLNFINNICERNNSNLKWLPIASSYGSNFIFTTQKHYDSIIEHHLMPPEGFEIDEVAVVHYPRGISAAKKPNEEILPVSNISCEVPMEKKEKIIYVKLWRKSKEGNLDIDEVPKQLLQKLASLSNVCNQMNWDYGSIVVDANKILSDKEVEKIVAEFSGELRKAIQNKSIELKNRVVSIFKNDVNSPITSIK